jgi:hypothetical protein
LTWNASNPQSGASISVASDTTWLGEYYATSAVGSIDPSYAPASTFQYVGTGYMAFNLHMNVSEVPEPASGCLLIVGVGIIGYWSRLSARARRTGAATRLSLTTSTTTAARTH